MVAEVLIAVPATIGALAAWRASSKTHNEVRTNHGVRAGERIEKLGDDMFELKKSFIDHAQSDLEFQTRVEPLLAAKESN